MASAIIKTIKQKYYWISFTSSLCMITIITATTQNFWAFLIMTVLFVWIVFFSNHENYSIKLWKYFLGDVLCLYYYKFNLNPTMPVYILNHMLDWNGKNLDHNYFYFNNNFFFKTSTDRMAFKIYWSQFEQ